MLTSEPIKHATLKPPLLSISAEQYLPGDLLQVDLVGKLPTAGGFTHILTAKDVFTKYLFAIPLYNASAPNIAKQLFQVFMRTSYIPKVILSDMGTAFTAKVMQELCKLLEVKLDYATVKHPQTVGSIERTHASLKQYLGIYENQIKRDWHNYVDLAVFVHNTSYHSSIGCTPTYLFHGRQPITPLDLRFNNKVIQNLETKYQFTNALQDRMNEVFSAARDATITAYNKYRHFYDRKASAAPLKKHKFCLLLNPKLTNVNDQMGKSLTKWLPLYRIEQVLTNSNYIIRKVGTNYTQCIHRIRLRPITPQYKVEDLPQICPANFVPDPITRHISEPALFDDALPELLQDKTFQPLDEIEDVPGVLFYYTMRRRARPAPPLAPQPPPIPQDPLSNPPSPRIPSPNLEDSSSSDLPDFPVNNNFSLRDIVLDTQDSARTDDSLIPGPSSSDVFIVHQPTAQTSNENSFNSSPSSLLPSSSLHETTSSQVFPSSFFFT